MTKTKARTYANQDRADDKPVRVLTSFSGDAFTAAVQHPILVEALANGMAGRKLRAFENVFTVRERHCIMSWYAKFHKWYFSTGTPQRISCSLETLELLKRAVNHFATI